LKYLKRIFVITDVGFILYWAVTAIGVLPKEWAYHNYKNPIMISWNWSFFPLDMFISLSGFLCLYYYKKNNDKWRTWCLLSLVFTMSSGVQAISFWFLTNDYSIFWWVFNLYLIVYPILFIRKILKNELE
jgi:hypothetical protein